jgi:hypothetical protein
LVSIVRRLFQILLQRWVELGIGVPVANLHANELPGVGVVTLLHVAEKLHLTIGQGFAG